MGTSKLLVILGVTIAASLIMALGPGKPNTLEANPNTPCTDIDGDGTTSAIDALIEATYFGQTVPAMNINGATTIDAFDVLAVGGDASILKYAQPACGPMGTGTWKSGLPPAKSATGDTDNDGCSDAEENGPLAALGGLRDYLNPWDFYDTNGDQVVTIFGDILPIAMRFGPVPKVPPLPYSTWWDRSTLTGTGPPDGVIGIFTDIIPAAMQYGHDCTA